MNDLKSTELQVLVWLLEQHASAPALHYTFAELEQRLQLPRGEVSSAMQREASILRKVTRYRIADGEQGEGWLQLDQEDAPAALRALAEGEGSA